MQKVKIFVVFLVFAFVALYKAEAQEQTDTTPVPDNKTWVVVKNDGSEYVGIILRQDAREVLIDTKNLGQIYIPKHEIRIIKEFEASTVTGEGESIPAEIFATRYFITTNGLPIEKGESYVQWNLYGPDFQWGIMKNFGVGIMTSWFGVPIIGSAKYSINVAEDVSIGIGTLIGTGSYAAPDFGVALPFGVLTFGDRRNNINFSAGYGAVWADNELQGRVLLSLAGMYKVSRTLSLVFDSFFVPGIVGKSSSGVAILIPGIRLQTDANKAFQFGFTGVVFDAELLPMPIPMVQWYRKF